MPDEYTGQFCVLDENMIEYQIFALAMWNDGYIKLKMEKVVKILEYFCSFWTKYKI